MKLNDAVSGALLFLLALGILFNVSGFPSIPGQTIGPNAFPGLLASLLAFCGLLLVIKGLRAPERQGWLSMGAWMHSPTHRRNFIITLGCLLFYILASDILGFLLSATLILAVMFYALDVTRTRIVPLALLITLVIHTLFYKGLRAPLPWGVVVPFQW
jgi:putative tricarboxylic transport membrane protein